MEYSICRNSATATITRQQRAYDAMYLTRHLETELSTSLQNFPAVAILGPRQCGKSTLAKKILTAFPKHLILDLERPSDRQKLQEPEYFFGYYRDHLICIDEVQRYPELFQLLRYEIDDDRRPGRFLLLGSASQELLQQSTETLAGRIKYCELTPLILTEWGVERTLETWWTRGGFPDSLLAATESISFDWRLSFIQTFLERDLSELDQKISSTKMRRFWKMLAHYHGQVMNYSKLAQALDVSHTTVKRWCDILEQTFMIRVLRPLENNNKKRLVKSPKVYLRDSGILHSLLDLEDHSDLLGHPVAGASWEGAALETLLTHLPRHRPSYYRTSTGQEIDCILERKNQRIGYEFKLSKGTNLPFHLAETIQELDLSHLYVIVPQGEEVFVKPKISMIGLREYCQKISDPLLGSII